jgi:hypothetical protein
METAPFFVLLFFHLTFLIIAFGSVVVTDYFGLRWLLGMTPPSRLVKISGATQKLIWLGWTGMVLSGIPLILLKAEVDRLMILKFFFVLLVGANGYALHLIHKSFEEYQDEDTMPMLVMFRMGHATLVSQIGWWGAFLIGFLHRHVWTVIEWPQRPWLTASVILLVLLAIWGAGEYFFRERKMQFPIQ